MLTQFVCLANSKKYGERCIAGVVVQKNKNNIYEILKVEDRPKWIRPVTREDHGQVPAALVGHINLLDVIEIDVEDEVPNGYQSENVLFKSDSLKVVGRLEGNSPTLNLIAENRQGNIFGNSGKAVHQDKITAQTRSLTLIKVSSTEAYITTEHGKKQYRLKFKFNSVSYDFPITDVKFIDYCESLTNWDKLNKALAENLFITLSLAVQFEEFYYKLVAGIVQGDILEGENKK